MIINDKLYSWDTSNFGLDYKYFVPSKIIKELISSEQRIETDKLNPTMFDFNPRTNLVQYWVMAYSCNGYDYFQNDHSVAINMMKTMHLTHRRKLKNWKDTPLIILRILLFCQIEHYRDRENNWISESAYDEHMDFSVKIIKYIKKSLERKKPASGDKEKINKDTNDQKLYSPSNLLKDLTPSAERFPNEKLTSEMFDFDPRTDIERFWLMAYSIDGNDYFRGDSEVAKEMMGNMQYAAYCSPTPNYLRTLQLTTVRIVLFSVAEIYRNQENKWVNKTHYENFMEFSYRLVKHIQYLLDLIKHFKSQKDRDPTFEELWRWIRVGFR